MSDMGNVAGLNLGKKVGPFPMGVYIIGIGGGVALYFYRKNKATTANAAGVTSNASSPITDASGGVGVGGSPAGYVNTGNPGTPTPAGPTAPTNNQDWYTAVFAKLVGQGYDPNTVDGALQRYLNSQALSVTDWAVVKMALAIFPVPQPPSNVGNPPPTPIVGGGGGGGTTNVPNQPLPPTMASPPKTQPTQSQVNAYLTNLANLAKHRPATYTVKSGDTLATIAGSFYGNQALWANLYNANRGVVSNPSQLLPGTVLRLPASPYAT